MRHMEGRAGHTYNTSSTFSFGVFHFGVGRSSKKLILLPLSSWRDEGTKEGFFVETAGVSNMALRDSNGSDVPFESDHGPSTTP